MRVRQGRSNDGPLMSRRYASESRRDCKSGRGSVKDTATVPLQRGEKGTRCHSAAAPATVDGEPSPKQPLARKVREGGEGATSREPGDLPSLRILGAAGGAARRSPCPPTSNT